MAYPPPPLPSSVEEFLAKITAEKKTDPADNKSREELGRIGEAQALNILNKISLSPTIRSTLSAYIIFMVRKYGTVSTPPRTPEILRMAESGRHSAESANFSGPSSPNFTSIGDDLSGVSTSSRSLYETPSREPLEITIPTGEQIRIVPPRQEPRTILEALGMLEFRKAFLILSYAGSNNLDEIISMDSIFKLQGLPMVSFERELWSIVMRRTCFKESDRRKNVDWDSPNYFIYHCLVDLNGNTSFKGPYLQVTSTHLHRVLGDDNVLMVKFAAEGDSVDYFSTYHKIAEDGIILGLRLYRFFVFKDGGKDKKKSPTSSVMNCYFVRTESNWAMDVNKPYMLCNKSIQEARGIFMHVQTVDSIAKYMARFSLILSKTFKLDINFASVTVEWPEDIPCLDELGQAVYNEDRELMIHTDGTGLISEDLAKKCPRRIYKGRVTTPKDFEKLLTGIEDAGGDLSVRDLLSVTDEPPLLLQVRLFYNGYAVKGTLLVDKRLPPETIWVRRSMIKVRPDPNTLPIHHCNSLEVVGTSYLPRRTCLSKSIIALLHYGGVPKEYFLDLVVEAINNAIDARLSRKSAMKVAVLHGNMEDYLLTKMILCGIPLDEPYLQSRLLMMMREELNNLKHGKIPINECCYLMGTADPTGILGPNEVCIILDNGQISGEVLVYKHPGLHFGDIHVLNAVFVKDIEEVVGNSKFAIFFPTKGPRSLADEMANSDFDGDLYWVSRNPQLIQNFKVSEPWKWTHSKPKVPLQKKPSELSGTELERALFHNFLKDNFSPSYAMSEASDSWMAYMDRLLTPTVREMEKQCLKEKIHKLIDKYYLALDAPKKGFKK